MHSRTIVAALALLGADPLRAAASDTAETPARGRLELRGGLGLRDDRLTTGGERVNATGSAVSELVAVGAWFAEKHPIGIAGRLEVERFSLRDEQSATAALPVFGLDAAAGATARLCPGRLTLEGLLGWGFVKVPLARQGASATGDPMPLEAAPLSVHGPTLGGSLAYGAADWLALEAAARVLPFGLGGQRDGQSLSVRRFALSGGASVGRFDGGGLRWSALVLYELGSTSAGGGPVDLTQTRQQISLGLRATFPGPTVAPPPPVTATATAPPAPRIRGMVRAAGDPNGAGAPLAGVEVSADGQKVATTDAAGRFTIEGLPAGLLRLHLAAPGRRPRDEVVAMPEAGEARLEVTLEREAGPVPAVLIGLVRDDLGAPVAAAVKILEGGLAAQADDQGHFRLELPPGRYTVIIEAPGFVTQRKVVRAIPGEQNIFNLNLQRER
jgi:hypothetical protein